ncbi:MAG: aldo/keto reductase family protein [Vulcanimicrobiota bacterium]
MKPSFLYGTAWKEEATCELVLQALEAGFRAIDTANQRKHYHEAAVGQALAQAGLARDELFLQTKFTHQRGQDHRLPYDPGAPIATQVRQSFESSLEHLGVERIDSYLLHGPTYREGLAAQDIEAWEAMQQLLSEGRVSCLGVSNVSPAQLDEFCRRGPVTYVQNRCFAVLGWDRETRRVAAHHQVTYQGFSLLTANPRELASRPFEQLLDETDLTAAQLVFRFALELGMVPLTGTTDPDHMAEDLAALSFSLSADQVQRLERISG